MFKVVCCWSIAQQTVDPLIKAMIKASTDNALFNGQRALHFSVDPPPSFLALKVVGNEKEGGSGKWQMIDICLGLW